MENTNILFAVFVLIFCTLCSLTSFDRTDEYIININSALPRTPLAEPVDGFTGIWPNEKEMPKKYHRDSACPFRREDSRRISRFPDVITIGFPKCGTGSLAFFDCHPNIMFRESEPMFFHSYTDQGLSGYALPKASVDEILIEKTASYIRGNYSVLHQRAINIKRLVPDAKIVVVICDPIKRFISHFRHLLVPFRYFILPTTESIFS